MSHFLTPDSTPDFSNVGLPSDEQMADMLAADADGFRCDSEISESELELLSQKFDRETAIAAAAKPAPVAVAATAAPYVDVHGKGFKAGIVLNGRKVKCPGTFKIERDAWDAAYTLAERHTDSVDHKPALKRSIALASKRRTA